MDVESFAESSGRVGPHQLLRSLCGRWQGVCQTWLEPGRLVDESPIQGVLRPVLDGRFVVHEYESTIMGDPRHGLWVMGYNLQKTRFEATWIDSFHNGTAAMFCTGAATPDGFWVLGTYPNPGGGPDWGWRTEVSRVDDRQLLMVAFNITPWGEEAKAIETALTRVPAA